MNRLLAVCLLIFVWATGSFAQDIQKFEGELNIGVTYPLTNFYGGKFLAGPEFGVEFRYNVPETKFDLGISLNATTAVYKFNDYQGADDDWYWEQSNRSVNIIAVGDYNFMQGEKINPYAGVGVGLSINEAINEVIYDDSGASFVFRPRVGLELFHHLRISFFGTFNKRGYCNAGFVIGGVIGGRPKKKLPDEW